MKRTGDLSLVDNDLDVVWLLQTYLEKKAQHERQHFNATRRYSTVTTGKF